MVKKIISVLLMAFLVLAGVPYLGYASSNEKPKYVNEWDGKMFSRYSAEALMTAVDIAGAEEGKTVKVVDREGDRIYFSVHPAMSFISFDDKSGVISIKPTLNDLGKHKFSLWVSDSPEFDYNRTSFYAISLNVLDEIWDDWYEEPQGWILPPDQGDMAVWAGSLNVGLTAGNKCSIKTLSSPPFYVGERMYLPLQSVGDIMGWKFQKGVFDSALTIYCKGITAYLYRSGEKKIMLRNSGGDVGYSWTYDDYNYDLKPIMFGGELFMPQGFYSMLGLNVTVLQDPDGSIGAPPDLTQAVVCSDQMTDCLRDQFSWLTESELRALIMGEPINGKTFAISVVGDMLIIGDIRDCVVQGYHFLIRDDKGSPIVFSLAAAGIASTFAEETGADTLISGAKNYFKVIKSFEKTDPIFAKAMKEAFQQKVKPKGADLKSAKKLIDFFTKNILDTKKRASYMPIIRSSADVSRVMAYTEKYGASGEKLIEGVGKWVGKSGSKMVFKGTSLTEHFKLHKVDTGNPWFGRPFKDDDEYLQAARSVINDPKSKRKIYYHGGTLPSLGYFIEKNKNVFLVSVSDAGNIRTFYRLKNGWEALKLDRTVSGKITFDRLLELP